MRTIETYSSSKVAAYDPEEKVQPNKPKHYTIYKTDHEEKRKCKKKTKKNKEEKSGEDD